MGWKEQNESKGWRYVPASGSYGPRFTQPMLGEWTEEAMVEATAWLIEQFGEPSTDGWRRNTWIIHTPDPIIAMAFRLRWC